MHCNSSAQLTQKEHLQSSMGHSLNKGKSLEIYKIPNSILEKGHITFMTISFHAHEQSHLQMAQRIIASCHAFGVTLGTDG